MKRTYQTPILEVIEATTTTLCEGSNITIPVDDNRENNGHADANSRRGSWGDLWNE